MSEATGKEVHVSENKQAGADSNAHTLTRQDWNTERYEQVSEIGVGAYGVVFKAKDLQSKDGFVAMKCLRVENTEQGMPLSMVREIALLRQLETKEHENVVKLLDICIGRKTPHETQLMLVFEHIDQDLDMHLRGLPETGMEDHVVKDIMMQMLLGIDFLHSMRVIHRDLKPQNILITKSGRIKIADFGLARIFSVDMALTAVVVTLWYRAPEVLLQDSYSSPVDLWSVGCIFAELYNKRPLFRGSGDVNQLRKIFDLLGRPSEEQWPPDVAIPITSFPQHPPKSVHQFVPRMSAHASDLFLGMFPERVVPGSFTRAEDKTVNVTEIETSCANTASHHRLPYTQLLGSTNCPNDENNPLSSIPPRWGESESADFYSPSFVSRHSTITPAFEQVKTDDDPSCASSRPASLNPTGRKRAFGNPLPLNVKDGASGELLTPDPPESAFLTPPSDLGSTSASGNSSSSRSSSCSEVSQHSEYQSFLDQQPSSHVIGSSAPLSESEVVPREVDGSQVIRRTRQESDSQSRMSWTCDQASARVFEPPTLDNSKISPKLDGIISPSSSKDPDQTL